MDTSIHNWEGRVILVVDDTPTNFMLIKTALRDTGVEILWAKNGLEAIDFCEKDPRIELVLMDIRMPVMDGYEAAEKIRRIRKDLPIIAQTSYAMQGDKEHSLGAGCTDYIPKPINLTDLKKKLNHYLNKQ
jgi:two-component system, cell cycle response regulator DivK